MKKAKKWFTRSQNKKKSVNLFKVAILSTILVLTVFIRLVSISFDLDGATWPVIAVILFIAMVIGIARTNWKFNRIDQFPPWLPRTIGVIISIVALILLINWLHPLDRFNAYQREQRYKDIEAQNQQNYYSPRVATPITPVPPPAPVAATPEPSPERSNLLTICHEYDLRQGETYDWYNDRVPKLFIPVTCGTVRIYCSSKKFKTHWISVFTRNPDNTVSNYFYDMQSRWYENVPEGWYTARLLPSGPDMVRIKFTETKE